MRSLLIFSALIATISASIVPINFEFAGKHRPVVRSITQCPGHEDDVMQIIEGFNQDDICMPGEMDVSCVTRITEDMPTDLIFDLKLKKLDPFPMTVPCLSGIGSCPYEICPIIENMGDTLCPSFPDTQPCGCPLLAGDFTLSGVKIPVPDMGPVLGSVMEGSYEATAEMYGKSNPDRKLACILMTFNLKQC